MDYSIPGGTKSNRFWATGVVYSGWVACVIPKPPTGSFIVLPLGFETSITITRQGSSFPWTIQAGIQLCDSADAPQYTIAGGYVNANVRLSGNSGTNYTKPGVFGADIAKCRVFLSCSTTGGYYGDASCTVSAGTLRVYYTSGTPPAVDCDARKLDSFPAMCESGGTAGDVPITRLRYRVESQVDGDMDWSGVVVGDKLKRYTRD